MGAGRVSRESMTRRRVIAHKGRDKRAEGQRLRRKAERFWRKER